MARPHLTLQAPTPAPARAARRLEVFISYSHLDASALKVGDLPHRLHAELLQLAGNHESLGLSEGSIFFDRGDLLPGDEWGPKIEAALARCDVFLFLASPSALASRFCVERELAVAVAAGKRVVPVILAECQWFEHRIHDDPARRTLGGFDAVPKDERTQPRPITLWADLDSAVKRTMDQLLALLRHLAERPAAPPPPARGRAALNPVLPFACNQVQPETEVDRGLVQWRSRALLVLVRGDYDDHVPGFWRRLHAKNVPDGCARMGDTLLAERVLQAWPFRLQGDEASIADAVRFSLADALTEDRLGLPDAAALGAALHALPGALPLLLSAPAGGERLGLTLRLALDLLEAAPEDAPLHRLVLAVLVEDRTLVDAPDLVARLGLGGHQRTHVVAPSRLLPITPDDVRDWFEQHSLEDASGLDREALVAELFDSPPDGPPLQTLRARPFSKRVRGLLGL